ncbi:LysR family transcriptional regulator [Feifania hominis]|nr:LysR family transcriptional regulator [Feifania hominis]
MKLKALEYFVVLAESQSINEAAQKLYLSQPSLTKSLQLFEKEIGVQLFYRTKSGIVLTDAGKKILPEAKQILEYQNGWKALAKQPSLQQIDIYSHCSFPDFLLPAIILRFKKKYPDLAINYTICLRPSTYISRSASKPVLTLFVCDENKSQVFAQEQGNAPLELLRGEYRCLVSPQSPLAQKPSVSLEDLKNCFLVLPDNELDISGNSFVLSESVQKIFGSTSRQRMISVESVSNVIALVRQDPETYALSYYPALKRYEEVARHELVAVPFGFQATKMSLCLFYSERAFQRHPVIQELVEAIGSAAQQFLSEFGDSE